MLSGRCLDGAWTMNGHNLEKVSIALSCRMNPDGADLPRMRNVFSESVLEQSRNYRIITEPDTTESRENRLQCDTADCDMIAFR